MAAKAEHDAGGIQVHLLLGVGAQDPRTRCRDCVRGRTTSTSSNEKGENGPKVNEHSLKDISRPALESRLHQYLRSLKTRSFRERLFNSLTFNLLFTILFCSSQIPVGYGPRLFGLLALGGAQGAVGWWMVKSGLEEGRRGDKKEIRVSPYRLAAHLCTAVATYSGLVWTGLELLYPEAERRQAAKIVQDRLAELPKLEAKEVLGKLRGLRGSVALTTGLTFLTLASGAFVAGNSAGNAYNDWPLFNGEVIPWEDMMNEEGEGAWKVFENTALVQFDHRMLAYATTAAVGMTLMRGRGVMKGRIGDLRLISTQSRYGLGAMGAATAGQVSLGVATLMNNVPIELAAMHQLGSVAVLSTGLWTLNGMRYLGLRGGKEVVKKVAK
jgi:heme A synthase